MSESPVEPAETADPASAVSSDPTAVADGADDIGHTSQEDRSSAPAYADTDAGTADLASPEEG